MDSRVVAATRWQEFLPAAAAYRRPASLAVPQFGQKICLGDGGATGVPAMGLPQLEQKEVVSSLEVPQSGQKT